MTFSRIITSIYSLLLLLLLLLFLYFTHTHKKKKKKKKKKQKNTQLIIVKNNLKPKKEQKPKGRKKLTLFIYFQNAQLEKNFVASSSCQYSASHLDVLQSHHLEDKLANYTNEEHTTELSNAKTNNSTHT